LHAAERPEAVIAAGARLEVAIQWYFLSIFWEILAALLSF
jgi:hypothetical protein